MLARQFRLPTTVSFHHASVMKTPYMTVRFVLNNLSYNRYGFIAGKKLDKRAVVRNRLKRQVRSFVEREGLSLKGKDILFILSPSVKEATFSQITDSVKSILEKIDK